MGVPKTMISGSGENFNSLPSDPKFSKPLVTKGTLHHVNPALLADSKIRCCKKIERRILYINTVVVKERPMSELIEQLKRDAQLWQGREQPRVQSQGMATGYPALDQHLGGQGWPRGVLTEILLASQGIGELRLLVPTLRQLTAQGQTVVWVNPPFTPYAPALARAGIALENLVIAHCGSHRDQLWTLEQALRNPACPLTMGWPERLRQADVRRLQLAAEAGGATGILFRPAASLNNSSPAHLRLLLSAAADSLNLEILKHRGSFAKPVLSLPLTPLTETLVAPDSINDSNIIQGPWQPLPEHPHSPDTPPEGL